MRIRRPARARVLVGRRLRRRTRGFATGDVIKVTAAAAAAAIAAIAAAIAMHPTINRSIAAATRVAWRGRSLPPSLPPRPEWSGVEGLELARARAHAACPAQFGYGDDDDDDDDYGT